MWAPWVTGVSKNSRLNLDVGAANRLAGPSTLNQGECFEKFPLWESPRIGTGSHRKSHHHRDNSQTMELLTSLRE